MLLRLNLRPTYTVAWRAPFQKCNSTWQWCRQQRLWLVHSVDSHFHSSPPLCRCSGRTNCLLWLLFSLLRCKSWCESILYFVFISSNSNKICTAALVIVYGNKEHILDGGGTICHHYCGQNNCHTRCYCDDFGKLYLFFWNSKCEKF